MNARLGKKVSLKQDSLILSRQQHISFSQSGFEEWVLSSILYLSWTPHRMWHLLTAQITHSPRCFGPRQTEVPRCPQGIDTVRERNDEYDSLHSLNHSQELHSSCSRYFLTLTSRFPYLINHSVGPCHTGCDSGSLLGGCIVLLVSRLISHGIGTYDGGSNIGKK